MEELDKVVTWGMTTLGSLGFFALLWRFSDTILQQIIIRVFSKEEKLLELIEWIDDGIIDKLKKNNPSEAHLIESKLVSLLRKMEAVILDKNETSKPRTNKKRKF